MSKKTSDDPKADPHPDDWGPRTFEPVGFNAYRLSLPQSVITFDLSRLRRDRHELIGELVVKCGFAGAKTLNGILSAGDFNVSSVAARVTRAKLLASRAQTRDVDWEGYLEELCFRVLAADRTGEPAVVLRDVELQPDLHGEFDVLGMGLPKRHPAILFGDGGSAKSLLSLHMACELAHAGEVVMYCDWEATSQDHKIRLDQLYPANPPAVLYVRCERPLTVEADRLRALVNEYGVTYTVMDSAAFGCAGAPESAEAALDYFRALRSLGKIGNLLIAHVTKAEEGNKRPFGSGFWHNSARATWHIKRNNPDDDGPQVGTLVTQRKCNFGRLKPPLTLSFFFGNTIQIKRSSVLEYPEFAPDLQIGHRVFATLARKPMTREAIKAEFADDWDSVRRAINRGLEDKGRLVEFKRPDGSTVISLKAEVGTVSRDRVGQDRWDKDE